MRHVNTLSQTSCRPNVRDRKMCTTLAMQTAGCTQNYYGKLKIWLYYYLIKVHVFVHIIQANNSVQN